MSHDQSIWAANTGMSEDTPRAIVYPPNEAKEDWKREADEHVLASLSIGTCWT